MYVQDILKNIYANIPYSDKKFSRATSFKFTKYYREGSVYDMKLSKFIEIMDACGYDVNITIKKYTRNRYSTHDMDGPIKVETIVEHETIRPPKKVTYNYALNAYELGKFFDEKRFRRNVMSMIRTYEKEGDEENEVRGNRETDSETDKARRD